MKSNDEDCVVFEAGGEVEEPDILFSDKGASWLPTADSLSQLQSTFLSLPVPVPQTNVLRHLVIDIWSHLQSIYIIYVQSIIVSNHFKMYCTYHLLATETFLLLYIHTSIPFSTIVKPPSSQQIEIPEPGRRSTAQVLFLRFLSQPKIRPESFRCHRTEAAWRRQRHQCRDFVQLAYFLNTTKIDLKLLSCQQDDNVLNSMCTIVGKNPNVTCQNFLWYIMYPNLTYWDSLLLSQNLFWSPCHENLPCGWMLVRDTYTRVNNKYKCSSNKQPTTTKHIEENGIITLPKKSGRFWKCTSQRHNNALEYQ